MTAKYLEIDSLMNHGKRTENCFGGRESEQNIILLTFGSIGYSPFSRGWALLDLLIMPRLTAIYEFNVTECFRT